MSKNFFIIQNRNIIPKLDYGWHTKTIKEIISDAKSRTAIKQLQNSKVLSRPKKK